MDAFNDDEIRKIVFMTSSQVGKTEILLNVLGYMIRYDPGPALLVQPTIEMAEGFSKERLAPMIRDSPTITELFPDQKTRSSDNAIRHKTFPGGYVALGGANSPASLASRPARVLLGDEIDRWPESAGQEGSPLKLAAKRLTAFWNSKEVLVSTPTIKGFSAIEREFEDSDQRHFHVPCPHCGEFQVLRWRNVKWPKDRPEDAHYECEVCGGRIVDNDLREMELRGRWIAEAEFKGVAGFHLNELYSPWVPFATTVREFLEAKRKGTEYLKVWTNTALGETWEDAGDEVEPTGLIARREQYPVDDSGETVLPSEVLLLTCAVDTQDDRLEAEVVGWGADRESWGVEYLVLLGDTSQVAVWQQLDELLARTWRREDGAMLGIEITGIDSGGHRTQEVYDYCRRNRARRVYALIGREGEGLPAIRLSRRKTGRGRRHVDLYVVGIDGIKASIYSRLMLTGPGPGFMHYPISEDYDEEYFNQLTAEKRKTRYVRGFPKRVWVKKRPRNEALDIRVYSDAILSLRRPNWAEIARRQQALLQKRPTKESTLALKEHRKATRGRRRGRNYATAWKDGF